jgi:signal transduction histidine kinase
MSQALLAAAGWGLAAPSLGLAAWAARGLRRHRELTVRAAHELRGPLTAIGLAVELERRRPAEGVARWQALELEVARAETTLEDLTRRRGSGLRLERLDAAALLAQVAAAAQGRALVAGVAVQSRWSGPGARLWGDRVRLAQALGNLIANAIEHGDGPVCVDGSFAAGMVRIEVSDRGPGLPAPVAALAGRARAGVGERGRGLAITAAIADRHGGRLAAAPTGRGARLVLELPGVGGAQ